jgi:hypothetical protein
MFRFYSLLFPMVFTCLILGAIVGALQISAELVVILLLDDVMVRL